LKICMISTGDIKNISRKHFWAILKKYKKMERIFRRKLQLGSKPIIDDLRN
jgi:hypothetical protein